MKPAAGWSLVVLMFVCRVKCQFVESDIDLTNVTAKGLLTSDSGITELTSMNFALHTFHRNRRQVLTQGRAEEGRCPLPPPMENGRYSPNYKICPPHISNPACNMVPAVLVPANWELFYSCDTGYILNSTDTVSSCVDGQWSPSLPGCIAGEPCPPLRSLHVNVKCSFHDKVVSCEHSMTPGTIAVPECKPNYKPTNQPDYNHLTCLNNGYWDYPLFHCTPEELCSPLVSPHMNIKCTFHDKAVSCDHRMKPGTIAVPECKYNYRPAYDPGYYKLMCRNNGNWDHPLFYCTAECGISNEVGNLRPLIIDGVEARVGAFPWHAGLYYSEEIDGKVTWEQKCGGSLITDQFVLSAAHCVVGRSETNVRIALGKFYRSWERYEVTEVKRNVSKIIYHQDFSNQIFVFDISLLLMNKKIKTGEFIMPVCHGFLDSFRYIKDKKLFIVGWGKTEEILGGKSSETLLYNDVMVLPPNVCYAQAPTVFPTFDKFCSTNNRSGVSVAQAGDSGGGLTSVIDGLHYIFGIVSFKSQTNTYFTNITWSSNMIWVEDEMRKYNSTFSWVGNETTMFQNGPRSCVLPEELASRKFCSPAEGCEDCDSHDRKCFIPPGSEAERVRVVCNPGYRLRTLYKGGDVATCLSGGSWFPQIPECTKVIGDKYLPGEPWSMVTWQDAKDNCEARGNELAIVKTRDQQSWFEEAVTKQFKDIGTMPTSVWIGLRDKRERNLLWVDGSAFRASGDEVAPWQKSEPYNKYGLENCVLAIAGQHVNLFKDLKPYEWVIDICGKIFYYFCKETSADKYFPGDPWMPVTWKQARGNCKTKGGQLAIIKSKNQQKLFEEAAARKFEDIGEIPSSTWIGLSDISGDEWFEWSNSSFLKGADYSKWKPSQPNNSGGKQHCVQAEPEGRPGPQGSSRTSYQWDDVSCSLLNLFFCVGGEFGNTYIPGDPWIKVTWQEANNNCQAKGYQLPVILNEEQQVGFEEAVSNSFRNKNARAGSVWLGLRVKERTFEWVDGSVLAMRQEEVANWLPNEPNNDGGDEYCVQAVAGSNFELKWPNGKPYEWNDNNCLLKKFYFCEKITATPGKWLLPGNPWSKVTWPEARDNCQALGYQLATIQTRDNQEQFKEAAENHFRRTGSQPSSLWIGLSDERLFKWPDNAMLTFTNWLPGEPSRTNTDGIAFVEVVVEEEDFIHQWPNGKPFKWNDVILSGTMNYYFCSESSKQNKSDVQYTPGQPWKMVTWDDARKNCITQGKFPAMIKSQNQEELFEEAVTKYFKETGTTPSNIWIGLALFSNFEWIDGTTKGAREAGSPWLPGEPTRHIDEICVEAVTGVDLTATKKWPIEDLYKWENEKCSKNNYYFCVENGTKIS